MPYPDAGQYDTSSLEWRDICLARHICTHGVEERSKMLDRLAPLHGVHLEQLAREQWAKRSQWLPAHKAGAIAHQARHQAAEAIDAVFRAGYVFESHAQIAASIRPAPASKPAATVEPAVAADPRPFELTP